MGKKNMRRVPILITAQTHYKLREFAAAEGYKEIGAVVDKLVRDRCLLLRESVNLENYRSKAGTRQGNRQDHRKRTV